jgi:hypothetical protein
VILAICLAVAFSFAVSPSVAQGRGECVTSNVPEAFTLPDGTVHPAGRLTLCTVLALNPVTGVHRVWMEGDGASIVLTRRARAEAGPDTGPAFVFRRVQGAPLDLVGFVVSDGRRTWKYSLRREAERFAATSHP